MRGVGIFFVWLLVVMFVATATLWLGARVFRKANAFGAMTKIVASMAAIGAAVALGSTLVGLLRVFVFGGGKSADITQRARFVAESISEAMNCTAFGIVLWIPSFVALAGMIWKNKAR